MQIKPTLTIENFHATSRRGVQQEIYAGLTLLALARIRSNHCEDYVNGPVNGPVVPHAKYHLQANSKPALTVAHDGFEGLLLHFYANCADAINHAIAKVADCLCLTRPNRAHHRVSQKTVGKWKPAKPTETSEKSAGTA